MTATATKTTTLKLTTNIPVDMDLRYIDVWPNDPSKNEGKGYGATVSLKGTVDGEDVRVYPKGFVNRTIEKLVNFGVIEDGHYEHDPAEKYSVTVQQGKIRIVNAKPAGERYENFDILAVNGQPVVATPGARPTVPKSPPSFANKPEAELPEFLRDAEKQDTAELRAKVTGAVTELDVIHGKIGNTLAVYQAVAEWYVRTIVPIVNSGKDPVGASPDSVARSINTIFINVAGK